MTNETTNIPTNNFALIGAAGYIAPRHLNAIKETKNELVVALDNSDSVGILDSFFPNTSFFTEFERFDRHIDKLCRKPNAAIDYMSICSPNYLHDAHIRFALRSGAHAICEKPLVLNPWNLEGLQAMEQDTGLSVNTILQLRLHPTLIELKQRLDSTPSAKKHQVDLCYITPRGNWYLNSWKGEMGKSGGIATNIGIHFFDMLSWLFGPVANSTVHVSQADQAAGILDLKNAEVRWFLSTNPEHLPKRNQDDRQPFRSITVDQLEVEFSQGFKDLHTQSYERILKNDGFGIEHARPSIELVHSIRNSTPIGLKGDYHPMLSAQ